MSQINLTKQDIEAVLQVIEDLYLEDSIPWVVGYSGGKDSTATVQLVWTALSRIPENKRWKNVYVISSDTWVESPVVAAWLTQSLKKMKDAASKSNLPIRVEQLHPEIDNSFWVNVIGRGYPYPRRNMRWCTDRLKIQPTNKFVEDVISRAGEAIMVLGTRKAESSARRQRMESYEKKRVRDHLSPSTTLTNAFVFSPLEDWTSDNVWQYLMQHPNNWGQSNKELLAMYSGASADGECPLVVDTSTPSCGNSRFGCWVCTMVSEDKSMAAMIQNDEEKSWMLPLLDFRNEFAAPQEVDKSRRDFRRMDGHLTLYNDILVHGPYNKEFREHLLRRLLEVEKYVQTCGPEELKEHPLIRYEELCRIRQIWLHEKHEFDDSLPRIYKEVTGKEFVDFTTKTNRYFGPSEWKVLEETCKEIFPDEELLQTLCSSLLDVESRYNLMASRRGVNQELEQIVRTCFFSNEEDALAFSRQFRAGKTADTEEVDPA